MSDKPGATSRHGPALAASHSPHDAPRATDEQERAFDLVMGERRFDDCRPGDRGGKAALPSRPETQIGTKSSSLG